MISLARTPFLWTHANPEMVFNHQNRPSYEKISVQTSGIRSTSSVLYKSLHSQHTKADSCSFLGKKCLFLTSIKIRVHLLIIRLVLHHGINCLVLQSTGRIFQSWMQRFLKNRGSNIIGTIPCQDMSMNAYVEAGCSSSFKICCQLRHNSSYWTSALCVSFEFTPFATVSAPAKFKKCTPWSDSRTKKTLSTRSTF